jgi:RNA polymerase sigma factor (sigma-70 family)
MTETNDAARFEQMVMPHLDAAHNLARWLCGNSHEAEDVTQEAFLRAFRFFGTFRGEDARGWILKIVRNTYYTHLRRVRSRDESTEFDEELHSLASDDSMPAMGRADTNPESILARVDDLKVLDRALEALPTEFREALVLRELEDLSYKQIAQALEVPIGTVMSRLARARRLLMASFQRITGGQDELQRSPSPACRIR